MSDLSMGEQRKRAGLDGKGRQVRRGKPVGSDEVRVVDGKFGIDERVTVVGGEERVDLDAKELERRRELFEEQRRVFHGALKQRRRAMPLHDRLREFMVETARLQSMKARVISSSPKDGNGKVVVLPSGGRETDLGHADPFEVERMMRTIERSIERLEELLDAHLGRGPARDYALMSSHEKNVIILTEFVGWRPEEVAAHEPAFGSAKTIRYVRTVWAADERNKWPGGGVRGVCGHGEGQCVEACPKVRGSQARAA